jgi:hypothetical protein
MIIDDKNRIKSFINLLFTEILEEFEIKEGDSSILNLIKWRDMCEIIKPETSKTNRYK